MPKLLLILLKPLGRSSTSNDEESSGAKKVMLTSTASARRARPLSHPSEPTHFTTLLANSPIITLNRIIMKKLFFWLFNHFTYLNDHAKNLLISQMANAIKCPVKLSKTVVSTGY